jgi:hypothetical protein
MLYVYFALTVLMQNDDIKRRFDYFKFLLLGFLPYSNLFKISNSRIKAMKILIN